MYFKERDTALPVGQRAPERGAQEFDERPETDEKAALTRVHAHLLEIHPHEREQGAEGRVEEEVEGLHGEELLVDGAEEILQDVALTANLVRGLLRLGVQAGIDLTLGLRVHHRPGRSTSPWLGKNPARRLGRIIRHTIVVILVSIVLHDSQLAFARNTETFGRVYFPSDWMERATPRYIRATDRTRRVDPFTFVSLFVGPSRIGLTDLYRLSNRCSVLLRGRIDVGLYGAALLPKSINTLLRRRNFYPLTTPANVILSQCHIDVASLSADTIFASLPVSFFCNLSSLSLSPRKVEESEAIKFYPITYDGGTNFQTR